MSTLSPSSAATSRPQRPPPPSLFLGPPSRNASNISLQPAAATPTTSSQPRAPPPLRSRATQDPTASAPLGSRTATTRPPPSDQHIKEGDRTEALWEEMQATLAEVELSAFSGTHLFGAAHSAALDELREAQIALARAWGREEDVDEDEERKENDGTKVKGKGKGKGKRKEDGGESQEEGGEEIRKEEEGEQEEDIAEARRRREANERYFTRIGEDVADVVGKLEGVAQAMAKVGRESREIWNGSESIDSASVATGS